MSIYDLNVLKMPFQKMHLISKIAKVRLGIKIKKLVNNYICITIYNEKEILFIFQGRLLLKLSIKYTHVFTIFSCKYLQIVYFPKIKFLIHVYIISTCFLLCINITYI